MITRSEAPEIGLARSVGLPRAGPRAIPPDIPEAEQDPLDQAAAIGATTRHLFLHWRRTNPMIIANTLINSVAFMGNTLLADHVSWLP